MQTRFLIVLMQLDTLLRRLAWRVGFRLRALSKLLMNFGEREVRHSWNATLFTRLYGAQIEITGHFPRVYCGTLLGASFLLSDRGAEKRVVLHLNWIATRNESSRTGPQGPWIFGGQCDVVVYPDVSPLYRLLPGRSLWFSWPDGNYCAIHFDTSKHLRFAGEHNETPRIYRYF